MIRVLIIEAVEGEAREVAGCLSQLGHAVTLVPSGQAALAGLAGRPHLAILSLRGSLADAVMAMNFIHSRDGLGELPIVILAGPVAGGQIALARRAGAAGVLTGGRYEPVDVREMVEEFCRPGLVPAAYG